MSYHEYSNGRHAHHQGHRLGRQNALTTAVQMAVASSRGDTQSAIVFLWAVGVDVDRMLAYNGYPITEAEIIRTAARIRAGGENA